MKMTPLKIYLIEHCKNIEIYVILSPCRDRIIHLLAIRPYKKPELIIRLRKGKTWVSGRGHVFLVAVSQT